MDTAIITAKSLPMTAWIVNPQGKSLPEYGLKKVVNSDPNVENTDPAIENADPDIENTDTYECWIPATEGEIFGICWGDGGLRLTPTKTYKSYGIQGALWLDGIELNGAILLADSRAEGKCIKISSQPVGMRMERPFQFGKLALTDKEGARMNTKELNTIRVELEWGFAHKQGVLKDFTDPGVRDPIYEKAIKKGNTSSAMLGDPIASNISYDYTFQRAPKTQRLTFLFHYASKDWLQAQGIMPPGDPFSGAPATEGDNASKFKKDPGSNSAPRTTQRTRRKTRQAIDISDAYVGPDPDPAPAPTPTLRLTRSRARREVAPDSTSAKPEPEPELEESSGPNKQKRARSQEIIDLCDLKSESGSSNLGDMGGSDDEIVCTKHLVPVSLSTRKRHRPAFTVVKEEDVKPKLED